MGVAEAGPSGAPACALLGARETRWFAPLAVSYILRVFEAPGFAAVGTLIGVALIATAPDGRIGHFASGAGGALIGAAALALLYRPVARRRVAAVEKKALGTAAVHAAHVQAILDTATEGIVTIDATGTIETFNGAAEGLFGWSAGEVIGRNVKVLMPPPYADQHDGYLQHYRETGEKRIIGFGREVVGKRRDGSTFPIDLSVGEGWIEGKRFFTAVISDITERHEMQAKLTQAERLAAVGELAAGIAHEVNNPINTMINCAQLIQDGDDPAENSQVVIEEGQRIAEIVQDLLQFARDDRDSPQPTSLQEVVERTLRLIGESFKRHGIGLRVQLPAGLPPVLARPQQIQQVILNLLINAKDVLQPHPGDRRVEISGGSADTMAFLAVSDNGPGIPDDIGNRVFEPFVTTKRARGGTGLGLPISKSIVEGYGGRIEVDSSDRGTTFRVFLPVADAD